MTDKKIRVLLSLLMTTLSIQFTGCSVSDSSSSISSTTTSTSTESTNVEDSRFLYTENEEGDGTYSAGCGYYNKDEEITLPKYTPEGYPITKIGYFGFNYYVKKITIPSFIQGFGYSHNFHYCKNLETVNFLTDRIENIPLEAFLSCKKITNINLPNSIKEIEDRVFLYCDSLTSVQLPNQLELLGSKTFAGCDNIKQITLPNSLKSMGDTFFDCDGLTEITIPSSVELIYGTFQLCTNLAKIVLEDGVKEIADYAFDGTPIKEIFLPKSVIVSADTAFRHCPKDLIIYCEADSLPENWNPNWNSDGHTVVWGAKRSDLSY